jgi:holo-[acyl-carrier protein] synthase
MTPALRTGVDSVEIERVRAAIARHGDRFLLRVYTAAEREHCAGRAESLAGRFAAKEAVAKALGSGLWRDGVLWTDVEILRGEEGEPQLLLHGAAQRRAEWLGLTTWSLSLTHDRTHAIAFVVALGSNG